MSAAAALVVCRDASERGTYTNWLRTVGYRVAEADSATSAIAQHQQRSFPLTLAELTHPAADEVKLIQTVQALNPQAKVLMFGGDSVHAAVAAIKAGAVDLLLRPVEREALLNCIRQIGNLHEVLQENRRLRDELCERYDFSHIIAHSARMLRTLSLAGQVARSDASVLITGESGTGKELLARAIHVNSSCSHQPMVSINCAAIPEPLLESELFGYRRGAFTGANTDKPGLFATAAGGTLFLDEVAELPLTTQAKLLRFLQDGSYFSLGGLQPLRAECRIIAATNAPLLERVTAGTFRRDLYYRLSTFPLHIPSLRERPEDIDPLARHFLTRLEHKVGKPVPGLSREAVTYLHSCVWRGNVRELENAIERAVIVSAGNLLTSADFRTLDPAMGEERNAVFWELPDNGVNLPELNRTLVTAALERTRYNISAGARLLGLSRPALRYRIEKYGLARSRS